MLSKGISDLIFLPAILFIGSVTTYEDITCSRIKNKWILTGLLYSFIIYLLSFALYEFSIRGNLNPTVEKTVFYLIWNFDKWCINLVISIFVAYFLWRFKIWSPGDAKLFICYSSLIPIGQYSRVYFNYYFASFFLLFTIFIPPTVFIFLRSIIYFIKEFGFNKIQEVQKLFKQELTKFNKIEVIKVLSGFFVFFLFFTILRQGMHNLLIRILPSQNMLILISLLVFNQFSNIFKKNIKLIMFIFISLIVYIVFNMAYPWAQFILAAGRALSMAGVTMIAFVILRKTIDLYVERSIQKTIPFAIWMFLGALIVYFF